MLLSIEVVRNQEIVHERLVIRVARGRWLWGWGLGESDGACPAHEASAEEQQGREPKQVHRLVLQKRRRDKIYI